MPPKKDWGAMGHLSAPEGQEFCKESVHKALQAHCAEQDPKFTPTAFKKWGPVRGKFEGRAFCMSCAGRGKASECTKSLLVREQSLIRYEVFQRGRHDPTVMAQRAVRGWTADQRDVLRKAPSGSSINALVRMFDDAGHASPSIAEKLKKEKANRRFESRHERGDQTAAELRQWGDGLSYDSVQQLAFRRHTIIILNHQIDNVAVPDASFFIAFACVGHTSVLAKIQGPIVLSFDTTFQIVFGGYCLVIGGVLHLQISRGKVDCTIFLENDHPCSTT